MDEETSHAGNEWAVGGWGSAARALRFPAAPTPIIPISEDRPALPCTSLSCLHPKLAISYMFGFITATGLQKYHGSCVRKDSVHSVRGPMPAVYSTRGQRSGMGSGGGERSNEPPSNHCAINSNVKEEKRVLSWTVLVVAVQRCSQKEEVGRIRNCWPKFASSEDLFHAKDCSAESIHSWPYLHMPISKTKSYRHASSTLAPFSECISITTSQSPPPSSPAPQPPSDSHPA
jgi:hypothetical protein